MKLKNLILAALLFSFFACSVQSKLNRQFKGKDKTELDNYFGQKGIIIPLSDEKQYVVYTQSKHLKSTTINKGVTTLDPMISPSVEKKQKYTFYLDKSGKVIDCKYDLEYQK